MLLTGHKTRAIFDRYNIINEQELLEAGDQLVEYLAQQARTTPRGRAHPARTAAPRSPSALCDAPPRKARGPQGGTPDGLRRGHTRVRTGDVAVSRAARLTTSGCAGSG